MSEDITRKTEYVARKLLKISTKWKEQNVTPESLKSKYPQLTTAIELLNSCFMTPYEQKMYIERARAYVASQKAADAGEQSAKNTADWKTALEEIERISEPTDQPFDRWQRMLTDPSYRQQIYDVADNLRNVNRPGFWWRFGNSEPLVGWLLQRGKCVYCDTDLIEAGYIRNGLAGTDHLLPKKTYPHLKRCSLNMLPACNACNCIKRHMDPSKSA